MNMKKFIIYITVMAILTFSCNFTVFSAVKPTADIGTTVCSGTEIVGDYVYTGEVSEGESLYRWYKSDSIFNAGTLIEGANEQTLYADKAFEGMFLTFAVVPVDINGTEGDEVRAEPIMQNQIYCENFANGMPEDLVRVETAQGGVEITDDPEGGSDKTLLVKKESTSSYKTEARLSFESVSAAKSIVDVQLYASNIKGTARLFGIYCDTYGSVFELQTDSDGKLYYRGGNGLKESEQGFSANTWNHVVIEIDGEEKTVTAKINDNDIIGDSGTEEWRFKNAEYNNVAVYFQNYGNGGDVYIKNLAVMNVSGKLAAEADAEWLENEVPYDAEVDIDLPSKGENGSAIYWKSSMPEYISDTGVVTRPDYGEGDVDVVLTAYIVHGSAIEKKEITITVYEGTTKPEAKNVSILQNATRHVSASYNYYDEEGYAEDGSVYQWYVEENGEYKEIDGANGIIFVPSSEYDGKNLKFSVTPRNIVNVVGKKVYSEPLAYVYYDSQKPIAKITDKKLNQDNAFEIEYSYASPDYIAEGETVFRWYMCDTLFGEYSLIDGATEKTYTPKNTSVYYKVSVTPVDAEGETGDEEVSEAFMYSETDKDTKEAVKTAIASIRLAEETNYDLDLPSSTDDGVYYTWVSSEPSVISNNGKITRPSKNEENKTVKLTAYAVSGFDVETKEFVVTVNALTQAPTVANPVLSQVSRPINLEYVYSDADGNAESGTVYQWYYKADAQSEFVLIEGANENRYAPSSTMDGYIFIAKIIPVDDTNTFGEVYTTPEYTYIFQTPAKPVAVTGNAEYGALALTGTYTYENSDGIPEGESEYKWYISDSLLGEYKEIEGQTDISFAHSSQLDGKYVKFEVTPKDKEGIKGDVVMSSPVCIDYSDIQTFDDENVIADNVVVSEVSGGTVSVANDPAGGNNKVLELTRTSTKNPELTKMGYKVPDYDAKILIIEADVYPSSSLSGTWEMFYICDSSASSHAYKLWSVGNNLLTRGGTAYINGELKDDSSSIVSTDFTRDKWHTIKVVLDFENKMMLQTSLDGIVVQENMPFRHTIVAANIIASYVQNQYTGTGYMDNLRFTPVYDVTDMAKKDAMAIDLGENLDAVIKNLKLPETGSVNGSEIVWSTSDENIINARGKVTRPSVDEENKKVTLTAHVIKGNDYYEREFEVTVMRNLIDEEIVEMDIDGLKEYNGIILNKNIKLPSKGTYGATYTWTSSNEMVITNNGEVTVDSVKKDVEFTVTVKKGEKSRTEKVVFTVAPLYGENLVVDGGIAASSAKTKQPAVYGLDLDYSTYWSPLDTDTAPFIIMDMGKSKDVNRLYIADRSRSISAVKLSASADKITWNDVNITKNVSGDNISIVEFSDIKARYVRVYFESDKDISVNETSLFYVKSDTDKVTDGIADITIPVSGNVTSDFEVVTSLSDGTTVEWSSSNTSVIRFEGSTAKVTRANENKTVTLTATVISGGVKEEKMFSVVVKGTSSGTTSGGGGSGGGGGGGSSGGGMSAVGAYNSQTEQSTSGNAFSDIAVVPWAVEAINKLAKDGVVNGVTANCFEPMRNITREEFAAILYRGFGFDKVEINGSYSDVKDGSWYYEPVMQLSSMGIINGMDNGAFGTGKTITRQDMAVMAYRAAKYAGTQFGANGATFADDKLINEYAKASVYALSGAQIINGVGNGNFNPTGNATRAEATVILYRIMNYMN